jgi:hypothetical protein
VIANEQLKLIDLMGERVDALGDVAIAGPPHSAHKERRLSCQIKVLGDVCVTRFDGYFVDGEHSIWTPRGLPADPALKS